MSFDGVTNASELMGCYALSNPISVYRFTQPTAGVLEGGPFEFCVGDGEADNIPDGAITLSGNMGTNSAWVVTDDAGNILGLPPTPYDVNFDEAPAGTCLVWHLSFEDGLQGAEVGNNAADLTGCYSLSNPISVVRTASSGRIALYPNPAKGKVNIDLSDFGSEDVNIRIFNLQNIQMFSRKLNSKRSYNSKSVSIDVSNYRSGIYFVNITDNISGKSYIKRLIVK